MKYIVSALSGVFLLAGAAGAVHASDEGIQFRVPLNTAQHVPDHQTGASGFVIVTFDAGLTKATYRFYVTNILQVTAGHFHCGFAGINGPVVVSLFAHSGTPPSFSGTALLSEGVVTNSSIPDTGLPCGATGIMINNVASLFHAIRQGAIYAHAHTVANPAGEIRGQVFTAMGGKDDD